jgi:hypothetical protein
LVVRSTMREASAHPRQQTLVSRAFAKDSGYAAHRSVFAPMIELSTSR